MRSCSNGCGQLEIYYAPLCEAGRGERRDPGREAGRVDALKELELAPACGSTCLTC
jgi:hypothetical protein